MRISDWSSDVCSSDLQLLVAIADDRRFVIIQYQRITQGISALRRGFKPRRQCQCLGKVIIGGFVRLQPRFAHLFDPALLPQQCRSEEHTSELQSLMRISYAVFCLKTKKKKQTPKNHTNKQK